MFVALPDSYLVISSVPVFELNEITKGAQVVSEQKLSSAYSICCGARRNFPTEISSTTWLSTYTLQLSFSYRRSHNKQRLSLSGR